MDDLIALAERVAKAQGADANLGRDVLRACGWVQTEVGYFLGPLTRWSPPDPKSRFSFDDDDFRRYDPTASIDAAMSLVPEGGTWTLLSADPNEGDVDGPQLPFATVVTSVDAYHATGATPALALAAAALRARSANNGK